MSGADKLICWRGGLLGGTKGKKETIPFHYFFQKLPPCDCYGTKCNDISKSFVCLGHLLSFFLSCRARKFAGLEFAMGVSIDICTVIYTHTVMIEPSPIRRFLVFFSSLFLCTFLVQKQRF